ADFTRVFRALSHVVADPTVACEPFMAEFADRAAAADWVRAWRARVDGEQGRTADAARARRMTLTNPKYILRTHMAQHAIERARRGDYTEIARLHHLLRRPFAEQPEADTDASAPPSDAQTAMLSCSS